MTPKFLRSILIGLLLLPAAALAALPAVNATTRYMSLGDSLAAGYKAQPATAGYSYQLYLGRAFGSIPDTVFDNASVPGATSADVKNFQLPQVPRFVPTVVTMSVGGNDLLTLLGDTPPTQDQVAAVVEEFGANLTQILLGLCTVMPNGGRIYLHNLYTIPLPGLEDLVTEVVQVFNAAMEGVVSDVTLAAQCQDNSIAIADVFSAFLGQQGLLLIERFEKKGFQNTFEVHPTNKGHRVIENTFRALIGR